MRNFKIKCRVHFRKEIVLSSPEFHAAFLHPIQSLLFLYILYSKAFQTLIDVVQLISEILWRFVGPRIAFFLAFSRQIC